MTMEHQELKFRDATKAEIDSAAQHAAEAFLSYRRTSGTVRAEFLSSIAAEIEGSGDVLLQRCESETGLPITRLTGERTRTVNQIRMFAAMLTEGSWVDARIDLPEPDRKPLAKPDVRSMLRPVGPVAVFGASNFPLAFSVAGGDTISALAAGCPVVFKAHPAHPGTCELVAIAIHAAEKRCRMPPGTFSLIQGRSTEVGQLLVRHPAICAVAFTGSFRGGKALFDAAVTRAVPIPVFAEMGSSNPVFVLPRMLRERSASIARDLAASVTQSVGQFCTNPGLVFLHSSDDAQSFLTQLSKSLDDVPPGVMLTESIAENYRSGVEVRSRIKSVNVRTVARGEIAERLGASVLLETDTTQFLSHSLLQEEVFGPSTLAVMASTKEDLLRAAQSLHGHLTATIHGTREDLAEYADLLDILEQKVGRLIVNGYPTGVEVCTSMVHGGPFPATTDSRTTSVGTGAITRFVRPVCYQNVPNSLLPDELQNENPLKIMRMVNGERHRNALAGV